MPHVTVKLYAGRSEQQKGQLAKAVTQAVMASTGRGEDAVSVAIEDVPAVSNSDSPRRNVMRISAIVCATSGVTRVGPCAACPVARSAPR